LISFILTSTIADTLRLLPPISMSAVPMTASSPFSLASGGANGIGFTIVFDVTRAAIKIIVLDRRGDVAEREVEPDKFARIGLDVVLLLKAAE
jgi:hypothetical protein